MIKVHRPPVWRDLNDKVHRPPNWRDLYDFGM